MRRRHFLHSLALAGAAASLPLGASRVWANTANTNTANTNTANTNTASAVSVDELPRLEGDLTVYMGRGEGGLYENVLDAIRQRNPKLNLKVRTGPTAALANTIVAEAKAGIRRADLFWAVDSGAIALVAEEGQGQPLPEDITAQFDPIFRYPAWAPISGRIRTLPFNTSKFSAERVPDSIMALADSNLKLGWSPAYSAFQSFITAMRLLEGEQATRDWLRAVRKRATNFAGELGVVMAVERGEVDVGFANHYYTLRLKAGKPNAAVDMAFTNNDAGSLLNASGIMALSPGELPINFIRYLLSREVQSYLASEAYEIPMVGGIAMPPGLPPRDQIAPPDLNLVRLAKLRPTLDLMRDVGVL